MYYVLLSLSLYIPVSFAMIGLGPEIFDRLIKEESYFEGIGALAFLVAGVLFLLSFLRARSSPEAMDPPQLKRVFCLLMAFVFFFGAGEEISWGQRILDIETPEAIRALNEQGEITVHNLTVFSDRDGESGFWWQFLSINRLFALFWAIYAVAIPIMAALSPALARLLNRFMPVVPWQIGLLFVWNFGVSKAAKLVFQEFPQFYESQFPLSHSVVEIKESNIALLFVVVTLHIYRTMGPPKAGGPLASAAAD